jgi:hypothetical protein
MASEGQIAANRHNASKSSGPRSRGGKRRASRNAYRHGLSLSITSNVAFAKQLEKLARRIAGGAEDGRILDRARVAAQAELDLARIRRAKIALIERVLAFGNLDLPQGLVADAVQLLNAIKAGRLPAMPKQVDFSATIPTLEPDRSAEAVRRALPELLKLERYARRAAALRDRAIRAIRNILKMA